MNKFYTGVGSRQTPAIVLDLMASMARRLSDRGWHLRSGGAIGADRAFESGACYACDSFRPEPHRYDPELWAEAVKIAAAHHPAWHRCNNYARNLHTRNVFQILGTELAIPSKFVLCWTSDGKASGGTGQAIRIADTFEVPVFNLHSAEVKARVLSFLSSSSTEE